MTTITTPAVWYIAVALPTLIATVGAVFIINRATEYLQSRKLKGQQKDQSSSHKGIYWNTLRSWLAKITNDSFGGSTVSNTVPLDKALNSSLGPPCQERPGHSVQVIEGYSPSQQQLNLPAGVVNRQSLDQQQSEPSARILDVHPKDQQQPKSSTGGLDRQSPGQQQLEPTTDVPNELSLGQQQPSTSIVDRKSPDQQQPRPSTGVVDEQSRMVIDSNSYISREIFHQSPSMEYPRIIMPGAVHQSRVEYQYRVTGVARVDSN